MLLVVRMAAHASMLWNGENRDGITALYFSPYLSYSLSSGGWSPTCPMNTQRLGVGIGVMGNCLYAVGGSDGSSPLNTVERCVSNSDKHVHTHSYTT